MKAKVGDVFLNYITWSEYIQQLSNKEIKNKLDYSSYKRNSQVNNLNFSNATPIRPHQI